MCERLRTEKLCRPLIFLTIVPLCPRELRGQSHPLPPLVDWTGPHEWNARCLPATFPQNRNKRASKLLVRNSRMKWLGACEQWNNRSEIRRHPIFRETGLGARPLRGFYTWEDNVTLLRIPSITIGGPEIASMVINEEGWFAPLPW